MTNNTLRMPFQKLAMSKKNTEWREGNVNAIIGRSSYGYMSSSSRVNRIEGLYDIYNGIYNEDDLKVVTNPFKVDDGFPATMQDINIVKPKVDLLIGEESKRPDRHRVVQSSDNVVTMYQDRMKSMLMEAIKSDLMASLNGEEPTEENTPQYISAYLEKTYKTIPEQIANSALKYLREKLNMPHENLKMFKDLLICGEEIAYVGIRNLEPIVERLDPRFCEYDNDENNEFIEDRDWFLYGPVDMSVSAIYDRFYDKFKESDLDRLLEEVELATSHNVGSKVNTRSVFGSRDMGGLTSNMSEESRDFLIPVYHVAWKSFKKVGFLTYIDEFGEMQNTIVDESYKADPLVEQIRWDWITEVWEGYRIGEDIYIGIEPLQYQHISIDNPNDSKLPYFGTSMGKSLVAVMKPLQYMYIILWYRLSLALARDKGKAFVMDITQIPKSMGMDVNKWLHYLTSVGVAFVNPYDEGWNVVGREGGRASSFNQISSADLSMSNVITGYIHLMTKIEELTGEVSGVTRQRQGQVNTSELVGNVERTIMQSSYITEPLFWIHNQVKRNIANQLINVAKWCWHNSEKQYLHFILEDGSRKFLEITEDFTYSDYDVFVSDSTRDNIKLEQLRTLLQPAMQNGGSLLDAAEILTTDNISEMGYKSEQLRIEEEGNVRESDTKIEVALIAANAKVDNDANNNGISDAMDMRKIEIQLNKLTADKDNALKEFEIKRAKLDLDRTKLNSNTNIKQQEIDIKRKVANKPNTNSK
jgi:hypothetical protein